MAERTRVAILISGRGSNMAALIYAARAHDCPYEVALVTGDRPEAAGLALAEAEGIVVVRLDAKALEPAYWDRLHQELDHAAVDVVALAGFMRIIPPEFIARWSDRMINIHPSLLPRHRGLDTHASVLAAGEAVTGATVHLVTAEVDAGAALGQVEVAVLTNDDADSLATRVLIAEHQLYPRILSAFVAQERNPDWIREKVSALALALPETRFKSSHGSPAWRVGSESSGKFFAIMWNRQHGEDSVSVLVKASGQDEMTQLIETKPEHYFRPAYYGPSDWIGLRLDQPRVDWEHVAQWLARSWQACAPVRLTKLISAADEF